VKEIVDAQGDTEWMTSILPTLEIEYNYWMDPGTRALQVPDSQGNVHTLNRYYSDSDRPRPESYVADSITAWLLYNMTTSAAQAEKTQHHKRHLEPLDFSAVGLKTLNDARLYQSTQDYRDLSHFTSRSTSRSSSESVDASSSSPSSPHLPPAPPVPDFSNSSAIHALFSQLTAGAESGWDFSSRWFHDRSNLTSVETMDLIPVDLNAILYKVEVQLAEFWNIAGNEDKAKQYTAAAQARMVAIHSILYNATGSQWQDYHIDKRYWKSEVMISNWIPLWAKCYDR
jgi:neutral trehalase